MFFSDPILLFSGMHYPPQYVALTCCAVESLVRPIIAGQGRIR